MINMNNLVHTYSESILDSEFSEIKYSIVIRGEKKKANKQTKNHQPVKGDILCVCVNFK